MIKKLQFCIYFVLGIFFCSQGFGENKPDNATFHPTIIPPAPTVSALGRYGNMPVNMATGAPIITIPLYNLTFRNASLPISLSYSSNGIRVDEIASWVGQGWSLNAGGVIARTVRGGADENSRCYWMNDLDQYSPGTVEFLKYQWDHTTDTEPDMFTYNFNGYTGKFIIDPHDNNKPYSIPYNNLKIEVVFDTNGLKGITAFQITTDEGIKYLFGDTIIDQSKIVANYNCGPRTFDREVTTAWHLKKIEYPSGEQIHFLYDSINFYFYSGISQTIRKFTYTTCPYGSSACPIDEINDNCVQKIWTRTCHLEKIISSDNQKLVFHSKSGREDSEDVKLDSISINNPTGVVIKSIIFNDTTYHLGFPPPGLSDQTLRYRMFLKGLKINGIVNTTPQTYSFEYYNPEDMASRLSFAQDHWGYFNGMNNLYFVVVPDNLKNHPAFSYITTDREPRDLKARNGLLKRIIYPTTGYTNFDYEQNTYSAYEMQCPPPIVVEESIFGNGCDSCMHTSFSYTVPFTQNQNVGFWVMWDSVTCGYNHNRHYGKIKLLDSTQNSVIISERRITVEHPFLMQVPYIGGHTYKATITSCGGRTESTFNTEIDTAEAYPLLVEKYTGGVRLKRTTDVDIVSGRNEITRYYYGDTNNIYSSSGICDFPPKYDSPETIILNCGQEGIWEDECHYIILHSNSINTLYNVNGNNIMYQYVIKSYGENFERGGEMFGFKVDADEPADPVSWSNNYILGATKSNFSWNNGLLEYNLLFRKEGTSFIKQKEITNIYDDDSRKDSTFYGYVFRKKSSLFNYPYYYYCTQADVDWNIWICTTDHKHWNIMGPQGSKCGAFGNHNELRFNECHALGKDHRWINAQALDNIDGMRYSILCKWNHLTKVQIKTYDVAGATPIVESTYYHFNNPEHALVNSSITLDSKGDTVKSFTYYPQDYSPGATSCNLLTLTEKHLIGIPIDERKVINAKLSNGKVTKYNDFGQPTEIYFARNELGSVVPFDKDNPYSYGQKETDFEYNPATHNTKEYKPINNMPTIFLWAYQNNYPIAEITGVSYSEVSDVLLQGNFPIETLGTLSDASEISDATSYLRNHLPTAMVVSYIYNPPLGIISKTDPAGITINYEYDSFGRLKFVKDYLGNIVKKYDYHYAGQ